MDGGGRAAIHVGPPRTLDVQQFAAARSSEVQVLYNALKAHGEANSGAVGQSSSSLTTPRHLRRRTTSHNRRLPFRWRHNAAETGKKKEKKKEKASSSLSQSNVAPATSEEESSRKRKQSEKRIPSRRVRRRIELQKLRDGIFSSMRDGTLRLATHVWHAKRFPMTKTWGYCLPQGLPGRGRGSKAVYKWVKEAAVLHDTSYIGLIELQGTEDAVLRVLCQTLEPPPGRPKSGLHVEEEEMHGLLYGNAVLHDVGKAPRETIAPVTFLWRPYSSSQGKGTSEELSTAGEGTREERQLWIWVHPSAFDSALLALSTACEIQGMHDREASITCRSRRGELSRLDIIGSRALQVLQKVLRPVPRKLTHLSSTEIAGVSGHRNITATPSPDISQPLSGRIFAKADCLPTAAVLALDVYDPRDTPRSFYSANFPDSAPDGVRDKNLLGDDTLSTVNNHPKDEEAVVQDRKPIVDFREDIDINHWEELVENGLSKEVSDSPYLWSPQAERKVAALSQKAFSEKRRKRRKAYFNDVETEFLHSNLEAGAVDSSRVEQSGACPVLLLKRAHSRPSASGPSNSPTSPETILAVQAFEGSLKWDLVVHGWSIIMPVTWVHAFWVPLVFAGGHVIGLRERHWLASDAGLPYFPHDFPDCPAHARHLELENAASNSANQARPPSKRSPCFTVSPLQRSVMDAYRDQIMDGSGRPDAVASELINEEHDDQVLEGCTPECGTKLTDLDGDTPMSEASSLVAKAPSHKPKPPPAERSANEVEMLLDTAPSVVVASHAVEEAVSPELTNLDGHTEMTEAGTTVTGSIVSPAACQTNDGVGTPELPVPLGHNNAASGVDALHDRVLSPPVQSLDGAVIPELANLDGDIAMTGIGAVVTSAAEPPAPSGSVDGVMSGAELTKPLGGDNAVSGIESLPYGIPPLSRDSHGVDGEVVPEFSRQLDGDSAMAGFDTELPQPHSPEMAYETGEGLNVHEATKPLGDDATHSSPVASQLQQTEFDAHGSDSERGTVGGKEFTADEMIVTLPTDCHSIEEPKRVGNVTDSCVGDRSTRPLSISPGDHTFAGLNLSTKSSMERSTLPVFVARTVDTLKQVFKENGQERALLLCSGLRSTGGVQNGLRKGTLEWRASYNKPVDPAVCTTVSSKIDAGVRGHVKGCHVRVLIAIPRRGVLKENGVLCSPAKDDFDGFLNRSQHWQGVETSWLNPHAKELKESKEKRKEELKARKKVKVAKPSTRQSHTEGEGLENDTTPLDVGCEESCTREAIGCITSTGPQGSLWSGVGVCEVSSLMRLRAMQWQDQRWWNKKEILLLAGNRLSPILRPVLVSIVLETGPERDIMW